MCPALPKRCPDHSRGDRLLTGLQHRAIHHAERRGGDFPAGILQDGNDLAGVLGRLQIRRVGENEGGGADEVTECPDQLRASFVGETALCRRRFELGDFLLARPKLLLESVGVASAQKPHTHDCRSEHNRCADSTTVMVPDKNVEPEQEDTGTDADNECENHS